MYVDSITATIPRWFAPADLLARLPKLSGFAEEEGPTTNDEL
jgi:hypothetical protein